MIPLAAMMMQPAGGGAVGPPLDGYATDLWAAWSSRLLLTAWGGNAFNAGRTSDASTQDIGFSGGILDTSAVATFGGANSVFPLTYYDQSGNGRNAGVTNSAPLTYITGTQQYLNSMPCFYYDTATDVLTIASKPSAATFYTTILLPSKSLVVVSDTSSSANFVGAAQNGSTSSTGLNSGASVAYSDGASTANRDGLHDAAIDGTIHVIACTASSLASWASVIRFFGYSGAFSPLGAKVVDCVVYSAVHSASTISTISSRLKDALT